METVLTYQYRIKDSTVKKHLVQMSSNVNFIWNVCNEYIRRQWKESRSYISKASLHKITKGTSKEEEILINSQSVQGVYEELYNKSLKHKKFIRFRSRRTRLGWIPFKGQRLP